MDLMIVDLKMPGMDGLEVIQVVNQSSPETEIILLTAHGSIETAIQALRLRIHDYLLKPASPAQILASVKKGLGRRSRSRVNNAAVTGTESTRKYIRSKMAPWSIFPGVRSGSRERSNI
ncbi:MAG: response regulator [Anaerolineales bacterium]|nr:response regulator [Anaerolineales bacterium]